MGTVAAMDADGDDLYFRIASGNTGNAFKINKRTGRLTTAAVLDYEAVASYTLTLGVYAGGPPSRADITIEVTDVNEPPVFSATGPFTVAEDIAIGTVVGNLEAADPEMDALTFAIASGNTGDVFAIAGSTGAITVAGTLDFETTQTYTLNVEVSDSKLETTAVVTINVTDVDDPGTRLPAKDINALVAAGNIEPQGLWSDGTTIWVADDDNDKLYAYTLTTGARDAAKEFDLVASNSSPEGLWSDETTIWVADDNFGSGNPKLYAY
ncbi:MAG: cadherin repeat domain-containing protein, partial [Ekhidna sp.]|nr:cadherin repeat domain-containing protein [Ekhidna sp.]